MAAGHTNLDYANENAGRAFPLDDAATCISDTGDQLPYDLITDMKLWFPLDAQNRRRVYLSAITVGPAAVSASFMSTDGNLSAAVYQNQLVASVVALRPVDPHTLHPLLSLVDGAGGWIQFGSGVERLVAASSGQPITFKFSSHFQSMLSAFAVNAYKVGLVRSVGKYGYTQKLAGLVELKAGRDIVIERDTRTVDGVARTVAVISLDPDLSKQQMQDYIGPCQGRPETGTCFRPAIFSINGVTPDCNGNIDIEFTGVEVREITNDQGIMLQTESSLEDFCEAGVGNVNTVYPSSLVTPYLESFNLTLANNGLSMGNFTFRNGTLLQDHCQARPGSANRTVATVKANSLNRTIKVEAKLVSAYQGVYRQNAYIIFGWRSINEFWFAGFERTSLPSPDPQEGTQLVIGRVSGSSRFLEATSVIAAPALDTYHQIELTVTPVSLYSVQLAFVSNLGSMSFSTSLFSDGYCGIGTENAITYFDNFRIDWVSAVPAAGACPGLYGYP